MNSIKKILVIDDDDAVLDTVELVLLTEDFHVLTAKDGEMGIELAKKHKPHVIILDVSMPKMNGYLFAQLMSKEPSLKDIPIILLTGYSQLVGTVTIDVPGVQHKLTKPFDHEELLKTVKTVLSPKRKPQRTDSNNRR